MRTLDLQKLAQQDAIVDLPHGGTGVKVSFQYHGSFGSSTREQRKLLLAEKFAAENAKLMHHGGLLDLNTLSVSGQTVEGLIPADRFEKIVDMVRADGFRTDILALQQVVKT